MFYVLLRLSIKIAIDYTHLYTCFPLEKIKHFEEKEKFISIQVDFPIETFM